MHDFASGVSARNTVCTRLEFLYIQQNKTATTFLPTALAGLR